MGTQKTIKSASGYSSLAATPLGTGGAVYAGTVIDLNWHEDIIPYIANTEALDQLTKCGQTVYFNRPPKAGPWRMYEKNQQLIPDQLKHDSFCISICEAAYKEIKFEELDIIQACEHWDEFEESFLNDVWYQLSLLWQTSLLNGMLLSASSTNQGNEAGRYKNIRMGTLQQPRNLNPDELINFIAQIKQLLKDCGHFASGEVFMVVPPALEVLIQQSLYGKQLCCNTEESILVKGMVADNLQGFKLIESDLLPPTVNPTTGQLVYTILFGWEDAYAFTGDIVKADIADGGKDSFGIYYKMLTIFGGGAIYPEALGIARVTLSTDAAVTTTTPAT